MWIHKSLNERAKALNINYDFVGNNRWARRKELKVLVRDEENNRQLMSGKFKPNKITILPKRKKKWGIKKLNNMARRERILARKESMAMTSNTASSSEK